MKYDTPMIECSEGFKMVFIKYWKRWGHAMIQCEVNKTVYKIAYAMISVLLYIDEKQDADNALGYEEWLSHGQCKYGGSLLSFTFCIFQNVTMRV